MKKRQIHGVVPHPAVGQSPALPGELAAFHARAVARRLDELGLTAAQRAAVTKLLAARAGRRGAGGAP